MSTGFARICSGLVVVASISVATAPSAAAQEDELGLRLEAQTPWTTLDRPVLGLTVRITNLGDLPMQDLSVGLALGTAIRARNEYETALGEGPPVIMFAPAPTAVDGELAPGAERLVRLDADLTGAVSADDSLVYPAEVTVFAGGIPVRSLTTAALHIVRTPEVPVAFSWWTRLSSGPVLDPSGRLVDAGFEAAISPGGSLDAVVRGLGEVAARRGSIQAIIEPLLVDQLAAMADGYGVAGGRIVDPGSGGASAAEDLLSRLRAIHAQRSVRPVILPFAAPELPVMLRSGLADHLEHQYELGAERVRELLGREGDASVAAVPGIALDDAALSFLAGRGTEIVLADAGSVTRPEQTNFFALPPTARVPLATGDEITLVLPDPGTQALFDLPDLRSDPVRLAQAVLGELAVIWREQPVPAPPTVRGLALAVPPDLPAQAWEPLARRLTEAPFLAPVSAEMLVATVRPSGGLAQLVQPSSDPFSDGYAMDLRSAGSAIDALEQTALDGNGTTSLRERLAIAEASVFVEAEPGGRTWLRSVMDKTNARFQRLAPLPDQVFTLTSARGIIPIRFGQPHEPRRVVVELRSSWFSFPDGPTKEVTLRATDRSLPFTVEATSSGRRAIRVLIRAGRGGPVIAERDILVGSTAANRMALLITGAAALGLVALWARRLLPRTRR